MNYELYALKYPAIVGMIMPILLTSYMAFYYSPHIFGSISSLWRFIGTLLPIALIYGAIGYFASELFRGVSKLLFQFPMFKEDETEMPTTQLLLWSSKKRLSIGMIKKVAEKIKADYDIKLFNEEEEKANIYEAKRTIVDAVGKIRECTRSNPNLLKYNISFGFWRNYLGASVCAFVYFIILLCADLFFEIGVWKYILIASIIQVLLGIIGFVFLKYKGYAYARALYNAYISESNYKW